MTIEELLARLRDENPEVRTAAWRAAPEMGAAAIAPLGELADTGPLEPSRAATRGLWAIVRHAGRPGAEADRAEAVSALAGLLHADRGAQARRDAIWMLSELGGDAEAATLASLLADEAVREDACMALERIPGDAAVAALQAAYADAEDGFRGNLAQSLRMRGVDVTDPPCVKLHPTYETPAAVFVAPEG